MAVVAGTLFPTAMLTIKLYDMIMDKDTNQDITSETSDTRSQRRGGTVPALPSSLASEGLTECDTGSSAALTTAGDAEDYVTPTSYLESAAGGDMEESIEDAPQNEMQHEDADSAYFRSPRSLKRPKDSPPGLGVGEKHVDKRMNKRVLSSSFFSGGEISDIDQADIGSTSGAKNKGGMGRKKKEKPDILTLQELELLTSRQIADEGIKRLKHSESLRNKCKNIKGSISGNIRKDLTNVGIIIGALVGRLDDKGDLSYLRSKKNETEKELRTTRRELDIIKAKCSNMEIEKLKAYNESLAKTNEELMARLQISPTAEKLPFMSGNSSLKIMPPQTLPLLSRVVEVV